MPKLSIKRPLDSSPVGLLIDVLLHAWSWGSSRHAADTVSVVATPLEIGAATADDPSRRGCLDYGEASELDREERERDQYPGRMTAEEIDEVVDRELQAYEAKWERIVGHTETCRWRSAKSTSATVVRHGEYGQVVEIKHGEVFVRVRAHTQDSDEMPSVWFLGGRSCEICVPGMVLGLPAQPRKPVDVNVDPTDISRLLGCTEARWSDTRMVASVCQDEHTTYGLRLDIKLVKLEIALRAIGGRSEFPSLRVSHGSVLDRVEVDISRLILEQPAH
jgi:hypothetical protein